LSPSFAHGARQRSRVGAGGQTRGRGDRAHHRKRHGCKCQPGRPTQHGAGRGTTFGAFRLRVRQRLVPANAERICVVLPRCVQRELLDVLRPIAGGLQFARHRLGGFEIVELTDENGGWFGYRRHGRCSQG
jgi:hypothetical protein